MTRTEKTASPDQKLVFIDAEFTSLDVDDPRTLLLEVGMVITDSRLNEIGELDVVIRQSGDDLMGANWGKGVNTMHRENGLIGKVLAGEFPDTAELSCAETMLIAKLEVDAGVDSSTFPEELGQASSDPDAPVWAGCTPWKDRVIIQRCMPRLYELIHYRTFDVTTLRFVMKHWLGIDTPRPDKPHRALEDAYAALRLARRFRDELLDRNLVCKT